MKFLDYEGLSFLITELKAKFVQNVDGKGLTSNDFTNILKEKLDGVETGAQVNKVLSVNAKQGEVVITSDDINFLSSVSGATVKTVRAIIDEILAKDKSQDTTIAAKADKTSVYTKTEVDGKLATIDSGVITVNDKSGNVVLTGEDIAASSASPETMFTALQNILSDIAGLGTEIAALGTDKADVSYVDGKLTGKVDKVAGKALSSNDYTNTEKTKLEGIENGSQKNVIELIKRNGANLTVSGKAVDITVPTKVGDLTNDKSYQTEAQVRTLVQEVGKLKKEIVVALPTVATADDNILYLKRNKTDSGYEEWMVINGAWEILGDTAAVDFTGYIREDDIAIISNAEIDTFLKA